MNHLFKNIRTNHIDGDTYQEKSGGGPKCREPEFHGMGSDVSCFRPIIRANDGSRQTSFRSRAGRSRSTNYLASNREIQLIGRGKIRTHQI
jgi:hypothetical protein